jgi:peroxiredoxin
MKYILTALLLVLANKYCLATNHYAAAGSPDSLLARMARQFAGIQNIQYKGWRELNYSSEDYRSQQQWNLYIDFTGADSLTGFRYQVEDSTAKYFFNGTEMFDLQKQLKTMSVTADISKTPVGSMPAFYNSFITIKNIVPLLMSDKAASKSVRDTLIGSQRYTMLTVNTGKRRIQNLGTGFDIMTTKSNFIYTIIIDRSSYLPVQVLQVNDLNSDFIKTSFTDWLINAKQPPELSWYYSTYTKDYAAAREQPAAALLAPGIKAPAFTLSLYKDGSKLSLNDLKGQVVLIDFWIKNCGPCIQSVPHLNQLQKKFKEKPFTLLSVNLYDSKEAVRWFCDKHSTAYTVLLNGKAVAEQYGVTGFPCFFVIDKTGIIIHAQTGYDPSVQRTPERVIKEAL